MSNASPAVKPQSKKKTFQELVDSGQFKNQIAMALPKHLTPDRFIRVLMTATIKNPKLLECTQESLFKGIFDCAAVGLEIDGRRAHLVPYRNNKKNCMEAQLIVDYKGIAELVMRSGLVSNIHADLVCENDVFEYDRGELKKHSINYREDRGEPYAVYAIVRMKDGGEKVEVMSRPEVERVRARSKSKDDGPWVTDEGEMWKKTVFKRASKWVPLSSELRAVIEADDANDPINVTPATPTMAQVLGSTTEKPADGKPAGEGSGQPGEQATPVTEYTDAQREQFIAQIEAHILDAKISERALRVELSEARIETEEEFSVTEQPTAVLAAIAACCASKKVEAGT
jgi:recombination protein RecT